MSRTFPVHTRLGQRMSMLGYTAADFAAVTGIHPRTLSDYLAGRRTLSTAHAFAAAEALQVQPDDIV